MAGKETKNGEQYSDVVTRLSTLVEQLEGGGLSLEDSLEKFAEGISLVRKGEKLLSEAEKRIEQLLSDDGKVGPLELKEVAPAATQPKAAAPAQTRPRAASNEEDDVPF